MTDAGAQAAFSTTSPPQDDLARHAASSPLGVAPASRHVMGTAADGHRPDHVGRVPRAAAVGRRQRPGLRLVGVRHRLGLQPHPHPRGAVPSRALARWPAGHQASDTRVRYPPGRGGPAGDDARRRAQGPRPAGGGGRSPSGARRRRRPRRGRPLRRVRQRPAHGARGLGRARELAGPRVDRPGRRRRRRRDTVAAGRRGRRRARRALRHLRHVPGRPPVALRRARHPGHRPEQGAFATYKAAGADELLPLPDGLDPRAAALAEPLAVALHGIHQGGVEPGHRVLVLGAGPIGALSIAALRALGRRRRPLRRAGRAPPGAGRGGRRHLGRPPRPTSWCRASPSPASWSTTPSTSCSSAPARPRPWRRAWPSWCGAARSCSSAPGSSRRGSTRTASCSTRLVITGAFTYDDGGFDEALGLLAVRRAARSTRCSSRTRCGSTASSTPCATSPRAAWPARCWCARDRARRSPRRPRFNHVAMSVAAGRARRRRPGRPDRASTATCSASRSTRTSPRTGSGSCSGPTATSSSCSSSPRTTPMAAPRLDHFGLSVVEPRRLRGGRPPGGRVEGQGARRRRPHRADGRGVRRRPPPPQLLRPLPPPPDGRDPALRVPVLSSSSLASRARATIRLAANSCDARRPPLAGGGTGSLSRKRAVARLRADGAGRDGRPRR